MMQHLGFLEMGVIKSLSAPYIEFTEGPDLFFCFFLYMCFLIGDSANFFPLKRQFFLVEAK